MLPKTVGVWATLFPVKEDRWQVIYKCFQDITRFYHFTSHVGKEYPAWQCVVN